MDDIAIIEKHEEALRAAMLANNVEALTDLLDDALVFTGPDGQVLSKSEDLSMHRDRLLRLDQLDLREIQVHRIGAMILTTTKATLAGHSGSTPFRGVFAYTRLWRQSGEHWRVVAGHAAKIG
ncbi:nuclear transport factor 2 family protein [Ralstonia pseudosolanacearum]|uniref:nuclear transport factor 2 family protein n=1 Tax=Ralstonia pseudosolanacearum TaxID=1310165 RepID=UPI001866FAC5|nr:nuclear transport factor 2 family protein [Ralstonia pseudosolanacearum]QOK92396.1 nuclear transport factor 2 family protein [Ralstonia pseudosolanacearum]